MTDRTVAVVQARMSSSRLPGKVLMPLDGLPLIVFMLRRVARARCIDEVVLATSTDSSPWMDTQLSTCAMVLSAPSWRISPWRRRSNGSGMSAKGAPLRRAPGLRCTNAM